MSDTTFVAGTVIASTWLNDVNDVVYGPTSPAGTYRADVTNTANMALGVSLVGGASRTVTNITALKALPTTGAKFAHVLGYYAASDGGGGLYWYDSTDTTSADNGGTIIVATDGGRWKLHYTNSISVKQFGAKGDNVNDDTAAFNAAIAIFREHGGEVFIPNGYYSITGAGITLPEEVADFSGLSIRGSGQGCTLSKTSGAAAMITILGGRATLQDFTLVGNNVAATGVLIDTSSDGQGTRLLNLGLTQFVTQGILNQNGRGHVIHDCYFLNAGTWAIKSTDDFQNTSIQANHIQGSGGVTVNNTVTQCEGLRIIDNTILASGGSGIAIKIEHGLEIYIANNILDQGVLNSIEIFNNTSLVKVLNNWISPGTTQSGVFITQNVNSCTFIGNTFNGGTIQFSLSAGTLGDIHSIQLFDNQFKGDASTTASISLTNLTRALIQGNITDDTTGSLNEAGGSNIQAANNIFKVAPVVSGGVTQLNNIIA